MKKISGLLMTSPFIALALAGCGGPPPASPAGPTSGPPINTASTVGKYGGELRYASISDPKTFNFWVSSDTASSDITGALYESLNQRNPITLKYEPRLAELPSISADGLTYTYVFKKDLQWSDGEPINVDDIIFTLDMIFDPKTETIMREGMLIDVAQPDGSFKRTPFKYKKVDDRTIQFILPSKFAPAETIFNFAIAPRHKLEADFKAGKINSAWNTNTRVSELVASGPYIISEYVPQQRVVYKRNPHYWLRGAGNNPLPYMDTYTYLIVADVNATTLKFRAGETDVISVSAPDFPSIKKAEAEGKYTVNDVGPQWGFSYINFNMNPTSKVEPKLIKLFSDVRFRRAVSHAISRQRMCDDLFNGLAKPLYGPVTSANVLFYNDKIPKYEFDLEKSKALLAEIGLKPNSKGMLEYEGKEVAFNILTNTENNLRKGMATIITDDLKKVGLNATFTPIAFTDLIRRLNSPPYDWQAVVLGFTGGPEPHSGSNIWRSSGPSHQWWPKQAKPVTPWEAEIDKLWIEGASELDPVKRKAIYDRWQVIAAEQEPFIFTVVADRNIAAKNHYGNTKWASQPSLPLWNIEELFDLDASRVSP